MKKLQTIESRLGVPLSRVVALCKQHNIVRSELFGSILRDDFDSQSDIDLMVTFAPHVRMNLFLFVDIQRDFAELFHRKVDLVMRTAIEESTNAYRKEDILQSAEVVYAA